MKICQNAVHINMTGLQPPLTTSPTPPFTVLKNSINTILAGQANK